MSVSDISSHLDDLYGYQLSEQTISNITEAIMDKAKTGPIKLYFMGVKVAGSST